MCFHTKVNKSKKEIEEVFDASFEPDFDFEPTTHFNGFSYPKTPVITNSETKIIQGLNWGLVPSWANADWNKNYTLNARVETLEDKPAFRDSIDNRCLIIVDGFYEWQHLNGQKIKYEIGINNNLFALAGLYKEGTYTIITTEAKGIMEEIHNTKLRMPIALDSKNIMSDWLKGKEVSSYVDFSTIKLTPTQETLF